MKIYLPEVLDDKTEHFMVSCFFFPPNLQLFQGHTTDNQNQKLASRSWPLIQPTEKARKNSVVFTVLLSFRTGFINANLYYSSVNTHGLTKIEGGKKYPIYSLSHPSPDLLRAAKCASLSPFVYVLPVQPGWQISGAAIPGPRWLWQQKMLKRDFSLRTNKNVYVQTP